MQCIQSLLIFCNGEIQMPNTAVPAAAEGLPQINRRSVLRGLAAATALAAAPHADAAEPHDPLLDAINDYRAGSAAYCALPETETMEEEEAAVAETYGPPFKVLDSWDRPAQTMTAAREALRLVIDEQLLNGDMAEALVTAALAFLDKTGGVS
jgi:hypothetical protein